MPIISPGPAYNLPKTIGYDKHCPTKIRSPQYSFGINAPLLRRAFGPGPRYKLENHTRYGAKYSPQYTFGKKLQFSIKHASPGPAQYSIQPKNTIQRAAPNYSFAIRLSYPLKNVNPAPNAYKYDDKFDRIYHKNPKYSMANRFYHKDGIASPGPAAYPCCGKGLDCNITHRRNPIYTMRNRCELKTKNETPGSNMYAIKYCGCDKPPAYSFGIKHGENTTPLIVECDNN